MIHDDLVARCQSGSEPAFRALYHRAAPRVHVWLVRLLGPRPDVLDVLQEVFVQVHRSIGGFRGESSFTAWLHRVTINVAYSYLRRAEPKSVPLPEIETTDNAVDDEGRLIARSELRALYRAMDGLSPDKRIAFALYELEGLSLKEIASLTGAGVPTVAARLRRARIAVIEALADPVRGASAKEQHR